MNQNQIIAFGRHVATFVAGMLTLAVTFNYISADQATTLKDSINQIIQSVGAIAAAVGPIAAIISGLYASRSASPANQIKAVAANPTVAKIEVKDPVVVGAIPNEKVVMASPKEMERYDEEDHDYSLWFGTGRL